MEHLGRERYASPLHKGSHPNPTLKHAECCRPHDHPSTLYTHPHPTTLTDKRHVAYFLRTVMPLGSFSFLAGFSVGLMTLL